MAEDPPEEPDRRPPVALRLAAAAVLLALVVQAGLFLTAVTVRLPYPMHFDWTEDLSVLHALSLDRGWPPYTRPHVEATQPIYTPGLALSLWTWMQVGVVGYPVARAHSVAAFLLCCAVLAGLLRREGASLTSQAAAVTAFLGTYEASHRVYDQAKVDSLALGLLALGVYLVTTRARRDRPAVLGGLALAASVITKQSSLVPALGVLAGVGLGRPRRGAVALATFSVTGLLFTLAMEAWCDGWFLFWTVKLPALQEWLPTKPGLALGPDHVRAFPSWLLACVPLALLLRLGARPSRARLRAALPALVVASFLGGYLARQKIGAATNVWAPFFFSGALCVGLVLEELRARLERNEGRAGARTGQLLRAAILAAVAFGALTRTYDPWAAHPGARGREVLARHRAHVAALGGPVLAPVFPVVTELAGGGPQMSVWLLWELGYARLPVDVRGLERRLRSRRWAGVYFPEEWTRGMPELRAAYVPALPTELSETFGAGWMAPHQLWLPRERGLQPRGLDLTFDRAGYPGFDRVGEAFGDGPLTRPLPDAPALAGAWSGGLASSGHGGSGATGALTSRPFRLEGNALSLLLGGGGARVDAAAELLVEGLPVRVARGARGPGLRRVLWDLRDLRGREVRLRLIDRATRPGGEIRVDDAVVLEVPDRILDDAAAAGVTTRLAGEP